MRPIPKTLHLRFIGIPFFYGTSILQMIIFLHIVQASLPLSGLHFLDGITIKIRKNPKQRPYYTPLHRLGELDFGLHHHLLHKIPALISHL
jgi:hypothetical protein